ncbi:rab GTPase activator [Bimuria novae-zelandiae CBS 107.79]|uniref:Rab GDP dissociation inhibitor n=1 Tax=Bimuria novae-zelandiae CBS 107.79 TaxID=1447943 RepID=A0A6A5VKV0_9PLEO|nr:rab GTPase activator [Bimuria novae-zelandiae CBS 107.79]
MEQVDPEYDVLVLGTGLTECVLSGVLSAQGKKVLCLDRNSYYGGESASLTLDMLYEKCGMTPNKKLPGRPSDWNIDLVPKMLIMNGELTNILNKTNVFPSYIEFARVGGSFVQQGAGSKATIHKVPTTAAEAGKTRLMGVIEKVWAKPFFEWAGGDYKREDPSTHKGLDIENGTMKDVYKKFGLSESSQAFIGHAMALYSTDDYIDRKGGIHETMERIKLYATSLARVGTSPYIYPIYGLGDLPQAFSRLCAKFGGTYMLRAQIDEFLYEGSKVVGVKATHMLDEDTPAMQFETKAKKVLADPSYFPSKVRPTGHLLKAIYILNEPLPNTGGADSLQLIIPQSQVGRKHDVYIAVISSAFKVCPYYTDPVTKQKKPFYIAIVSTTAETDANPQEELKFGKERLGPATNIVEEFHFPPTPLYEPLESGENDNVFISKSYDATSHYETTTDDIRDIYQRVEGKPFNLDGLVAQEEMRLAGE